MNIATLHELFLNSSGISTDTRKIKEDSIFFALKGANFNANSFATEALKKGAKYAVIDEQQETSDDRFIHVEDCLQSLQQLATYHRTHLNIPILALTGSNGKTTSKELINVVLSKKFKTVATEGNLNNHIGVPLTLLSMDKTTEFGIVEMGANHQKEIEFLCSLAQPDYGYITNFGKAHLEGFGSVEGVVKGKKELYKHLKAAQKLLFLNIDDPLQKMEENYEHTFSFGEAQEADLQLTYISKNAFAGIKVQEVSIFGNLLGSYNARNIAAAYCIGKYFEVPANAMQQALENYIPQNNRSQILEKNSNRIILDAYNANPSSMAVAIENFSRMQGGSKIAFLGDMFELGAAAKQEHQEIVHQLKSADFDRIFLLGENFYATETDSDIKKFKSFEAFKAAFEPGEIKDATILIKGSRGMALERIVSLL
jgi:UDP-N-acetylmuramoyl-tripeptide--D-alanyl-D-alanine ligase